MIFLDSNNTSKDIIVNLPSSYALSATVAAMFAEIFRIQEYGGYRRPLAKSSSFTCAAKPSAV